MCRKPFYEKSLAASAFCLILVKQIQFSSAYIDVKAKSPCPSCEHAERGQSDVFEWVLIFIALEISSGY